MPTIDVGGVEKNFILISNFLAQNLEKVTIVTTSYNLKNAFKKNIKFASYKNIDIKLIPRRIKFLIALIILFIELLKNKNNLVFSFQANFYCILLCKLLRTKVIIRSNTSPTGWSNNIVKKKLYKYTLYLADIVLANSIKFKNILNNEFGIKAICIYNPLNVQEIIKKSKIVRAIPLPFISLRRGPVPICPPDKQVKSFFDKLGTTVLIRSELSSNNFWATSGMMAPFYEILKVLSDWLVKKGIKRNEAQKYVTSLFVALSEDSKINSKKNLKYLVSESQTPGGLNEQAVKQLRKSGFYKSLEKSLNNILKRLNKK